MEDDHDDENKMDVGNEPPLEEDKNHHDEPWVENIFKHNGDMPEHTPIAVINELADIRKTTKLEGKGNNCLPDDFAKINY